MTKDQEVSFTKDWWSRTLSREETLVSWLQKLYRTELGGYTDYIDFVKRFVPDERTTKIFSNIGDDELKHSRLIWNLLDSKGVQLEKNPPLSLYWGEMNKNIITLEDAAAVNYFGEALAAFRFEVMVEHPETPSDIREMLGIILPDEQFHRETLRRMISDETYEKFKGYHHDAAKNLKGAK